MTVVLRGRGRGRRRADASELARQSWADAVACARRNYLASQAWEDTCREAVRQSGPAPARRRRPEPEPVCVVVFVVVAVGGGAMR